MEAEDEKCSRWPSWEGLQSQLPLPVLSLHLKSVGDFLSSSSCVHPGKAVVGLAVLGLQLHLMILKVFSSLNDSMKCGPDARKSINEKGDAKLPSQDSRNRMLGRGRWCCKYLRREPPQ